MVDRSVPDQLKRLLLPERKIRVPDNPLSRPHQRFLRYHRENIYRGTVPGKRPYMGEMNREGTRLVRELLGLAKP